MDTKQVIVIRKDLKMRKGKMISQGAHASLKVILDMMVDYDPWEDQYMYEYIHSMNPRKYKEKHLKLEKDSPLENWIEGTFTKITCSVDSLEELKELNEKAKKSKIPCSIITDIGKTEFNGIPTITAIAIGPADVKRINPITQNLKLL